MRGAQRTEPRARIDGVLLLDKPLGLTSNAALMRVRRLFNAAKAGHGGTLDPLATGLLPVALGEATKFLHDVLEADKTYDAEFTLGATTTTADAEGEVLEARAVEATDAGIRAACAALVGAIEQVPPMHSALKREGRPLYAYARAGEVIEREARPVTIHALDVLAIERTVATGADDPARSRVKVRARVRCSKGTYIRVLAEDVGARLGCGAHLSALRRVAVGTLDLVRAVGLDAIEALEPSRRLGLLSPVDALIDSLARVDLPDDLANRFLQGQRVIMRDDRVLADAREAARRRDCEGTARTTSPLPVRVYGDRRLLGLAEFTPPGLLAPSRLVHLAGPAIRWPATGRTNCSPTPRLDP